MKSNEIKEWQACNAHHKVATVLVMDKIAFSYDEENGVVFAAPADYVEKLKLRLVTVFGCSVKPIIVEVK